MSTLKDVISDLNARKSVAAECVALIEREVAQKGGLTGVALKTGYKAVKGIKPGFVDRVVYDLLPEFADAVAPIVAEARASNTPVASYLDANASRVADALLAITDKKAERSTNGVVKSAYGKLRGMAKSNVETAIPGLAKIVASHTV
jgi:hypothetical protein